MAKRITIKDVASAAGVSVATVSYILNSTPGKTISEQTKQKVLAAAEQLQYIPNIAAQQLKTNRTKCIAVRLSNTLVLTRYNNTLQGVRERLAASGYSILLSTFDERGSLAGCVDSILRGQADGLLYIASQGIGILPEEMDILRKHNVPVSAIDCMGSVPDVSSVTYDYYASSRDRMDVLLQNGYRKFLYLRPSFANHKEVAREQGVRSVLMERNDVTLEVRHIQSLGDKWMQRQQAIGKLGTAQNQTDSITQGSVFFSNEVKEILKDLPEDVAVVCYARELQESAAKVLMLQSMAYPADTRPDWTKRCISYHFPNFEAGIEAAASLINMIDGDGTAMKKSVHPILDFYTPDLM